MILDNSMRQQTGNIILNSNRNNVDLKLVSQPSKTYEYYIKSIKSALLGWQPKVLVLNSFVNDLRSELRKLPVNNASWNLRVIDRLIDRDIDYVTDNEYISCIKFILEHWQTDLIRQKIYIQYAYDRLQLRNIPFDNHLGFSLGTQK